MSFFIIVVRLGISVEVAVNRISQISIYPPPPPPLSSSVFVVVVVVVLFFFDPTHNSLFNTSESYLKSVRA